jgi:hypothetical protein
MKDPVPFVEEAGWAPGPVWTCAENLAPTGIRSPDRPALSQSLYRLSYPAHRTESAVAKLISHGRFFVALLPVHAGCELTSCTPSRFGIFRYITV